MQSYEIYFKYWYCFAVKKRLRFWDGVAWDGNEGCLEANFYGFVAFYLRVNIGFGEFDCTGI